MKLLRNFLKSLAKLRHRLRDEKGASTAEALIGMAIFGIIMPFIITLAVGAIQARDNANNGVDNVISAAAINTVLVNDVATSTSMRLTSPNRLDIRTSRGSCVAWNLSSGNLQRAESEKTAITTAAIWETVISNVKNPSETKAFTQDGPKITYTFHSTGNKKDSAKPLLLTGTMQSKLAPTGKGVCW